tara:strand:- start:37672 stop:37977 length:306 start_codon:yes stop_codon:yes gene_type:complete
MSSLFVLIRHDDRLIDDLEILPDGDYDTIHEAIGGYITYMPRNLMPNQLPYRNGFRKLLNVILDEEGGLKNLPFNKRATLMLGGGYPILGDAILEIGEVIE